jgi:hypothetical protein
MKRKVSSSMKEVANIVTLVSSYFGRSRKVFGRKIDLAPNKAMNEFRPEINFPKVE